MNIKSEFPAIISIPINNEFDRGIIRTKILKLQTLHKEIFINIKKYTEKDKEFIIQYENQKYSRLRSLDRQKQTALTISKLTKLPSILKQNSINTRISIANIFVDTFGSFIYYLNLKQFDISSKQQGELLQKMYIMQWQTIMSIIGSKKQSPSHIPNCSSISNIKSSSPKHSRQTTVIKPCLKTQRSVNNLTESKRFFTSSNKPQPKSKEDFNMLKSLQFQNILNKNQDYIHQFNNILCDKQSSKVQIQESYSHQVCSKFTKSF